MNWRVWIVVVFGLVLTVSSGFSETTNAADHVSDRPANWAIELNRPGLPNLYQLTTNFYRGAQPDSRGMTELKAMGVKTVVNLRTFHSDAKMISDTNLSRAHLKMQPWHADEEEIVAFLKIVGDTNNLPVFVHCQRGADRTGTMCAMYRIIFCGWSKQAAIKEMKDGGFGFNPTWQNLVNYIKAADIEKLKRSAGLAGK